MSPDLSPISGQLLPSDARRAGRASSRYATAAQVRAAAIDAEVDGAIAKADGFTAVAGSASSNVLRVAQLHRQLELVDPTAAGRLALIADDHALTMVDILGDLRRGLRRR